MYTHGVSYCCAWFEIEEGRVYSLLARITKWWLVPLAAFAYFLLQSIRGQASGYIRPPGAAEEDLFLSLCLRCGQCAQACPYHSIQILGPEAGASSGTPAMSDLRNYPCQLCTEYCTLVCPNKALEYVEGSEVRAGLARIDMEKCRSWQEDECRVCYMACPIYKEALILKDFKKTFVISDKCTGCGICEHVCILDRPAITVVPRGEGVRS